MHRIARAFVGALTALAAAMASVPAFAFDAHNPEDVLSVLVTNGASGTMKTNDKGVKYIDAKTGELIFEVDFYDCDKAQKSCDTVLYLLGYDSELVTVDQLNTWNRWTFLCPGYLTLDKHPHVWLTVLPSVHDTRDDIAAQQNRWQRCLRDFDQFTGDPQNFIKTVIDK